MLRRTLIDFYADLSAIDGEFVVYDDGYRSWSYTLRAGHRSGARRLRRACATPGSHQGQAVAIWSENRAEWIVALWGCLLEGVVLVPIDYRASADFLLRVAAIVDARAVLVGDAVDAHALGAERPVWNLAELRPHAGAPGDAPTPFAHPTRERQPDGLQPDAARDGDRGHESGNHLHVRRHGRAQGRRHHPPQHPGEHRPDRAGDGEVPEVRRRRSCRSGS